MSSQAKIPASKKPSREKRASRKSSCSSSDSSYSFNSSDSLETESSDSDLSDDDETVRASASGLSKQDQRTILNEYNLFVFRNERAFPPPGRKRMLSSDVLTSKILLKELKNNLVDKYYPSSLYMVKSFKRAAQGLLALLDIYLPENDSERLEIFMEKNEWNRSEYGFQDVRKIFVKYLKYLESRFCSKRDVKQTMNSPATLNMFNQTENLDDYLTKIGPLLQDPLVKHLEYPQGYVGLGLDPTYRLQLPRVLNSDPRELVRSMREKFTRVRRVDDMLDEQQMKKWKISSQSRASGPKQKKPKVNCYTCGTLGHISKDCWFKNQ